MDLLSKKCVPCEGGVKPLSQSSAQEYLREVPDWTLLEDKKIENNYLFKDFKKALDFVNQVGDIAEEEQHHPDILLHGWNKVKVTLFTHAIKGLSENDFIVAAKVDKLFSSLWVDKK